MSDPKKIPTPEEYAAIIAELGWVPMSKVALENMSINPYDQLFILRLMKMRDQAAKQEMLEALAEVVSDQNQRMFAILGDQTKVLEVISKDIVEIKRRLTKDEKKLAEITKQITSIRKRLGLVEGKVKVFECKK